MSDERNVDAQPADAPQVDAAPDHDSDSDVFAAADITPEVAVDESLRNALEQMRDESTRIAELATGDEQVQAAEQFVDAAGQLDERIGSQARAEDDRGR